MKTALQKFTSSRGLSLFSLLATIVFYYLSTLPEVSTGIMLAAWAAGSAHYMLTIYHGVEVRAHVVMLIVLCISGFFLIIPFFFMYWIIFLGPIYLISFLALQFMY